jgi:hypothetical protein
MNLFDSYLNGFQTASYYSELKFIYLTLKYKVLYIIFVTGLTKSLSFYSQTLKHKVLYI